MAFTNNKNQQVEYNLNKRMDLDKLNYMLNLNSCENKSKAVMFELGGGVPKLSSKQLSYNNVDVESKLRGIKSNNLEGNCFNPELQPRQFEVDTLFRKSQTFVPPSFFHVSQRNGFHNL